MGSRLNIVWLLVAMGVFLVDDPANSGSELPVTSEAARVATASPSASIPSTPTPTPTPEHDVAILPRQPVAFVPNLGQWDGDFAHKARIGPMTVFLQDRGWTLALLEHKAEGPVPNDPFADRGVSSIEPGRGVAIGMRFRGADPATLIEEDRVCGLHNYFLGNDPKRWRSNVTLHGSVLMSGLYPGIDLRARSQDGHFEYDLLLEPGTALDQVVVEVEGADGLRLDPDGALVIDTALGPVRQPLPKTWQVDGLGQRQSVACHYVLLGERCFGFEAADRDRDLALVVDPGLVYSTYLGGSAYDVPVTLALNSIGAVTVGGQTQSVDFPTTMGAFDTTLNPGPTYDAVLTRFDPSGSTLVYSTYLGGSDVDQATALALDATGAATLCGLTASTDFPTTAGALSTTYNGVGPSGHDGFVTRLDLSLAVAISQPQGPGGVITIDNANLIPGNEYYNIFSLDVSLGAPGSGALAGLWVVTVPNIQFLWNQLTTPVGTIPFHFIAPSGNVSWGPFSVGPVTLDALCFDFTGGILGPISAVTRITIQ